VRGKNRAVFIDRDNTICRDVPYCSRPEDLELLPKVTDGIRLLNEHGFKVVVITNQSGVARGYFTEDVLSRIHQKMQGDLAERGASVDAIYYCPHHPDNNCDCRKPKPTMLFQAAHDLDIDLRKSYVIGDSDMDTKMGKEAGCVTIIVLTTNQNDTESRKPEPDYIANDLYEAADWVIQNKAAEMQ
jgi:D,D-heptose 1,7-bisphosphate phosphatase